MPTPDELHLALLLLRVVVGPVFAFHGFAKVFRGGRLAGTAGWFDSIGMRPGHLHARLAAGGELATGICLALGLLTPLAGLGLVGLMAVAFRTVHRGHGLLVIANGWEYNLVLAAVGVTLATTGPGRWSLDHALGLDLTGAAGLAVALGGGLATATFVLATSFHPPPTPTTPAPTPTGDTGPDTGGGAGAEGEPSAPVVARPDGDGDA